MTVEVILVVVVVEICVEVEFDLAQDDKIRDITMRPDNTIQTIPFFIQTSSLFGILLENCK